MLYIIGLGLGNAKDVSVGALEAIKTCDKVFLESYTSILPGLSAADLGEFYGKDVIVADRELVESGSDTILGPAKEGQTVAFLVIGDPFGATTHTDFVLRAKQDDIPYKVFHNASVMNAVGAAGLQLYKYGQTISIPYWTDMWKPDSYYDKIVANTTVQLHTLALLDIKVKEVSEENLARGRMIYEPPRFMSIPESIGQLLAIEESKQKGVTTPESLAVGVARLGAEDQIIAGGTLAQLAAHNWGAPLHALIIVGPMDEVEKEFFESIQLPQ